MKHIEACAWRSMHAMCVKRFARACVRAFYTSARVRSLIMRFIFLQSAKKSYESFTQLNTDCVAH